MDGGPFLLHLQNGTVDIRTNTIRPSSPLDYVKKVSNVVVPEYVFNVSREPASAAVGRYWVYNILWSIYAPCRRGEPHVLDWRGAVAGKISRNFEYFPSYMARILDGGR